MSRFLARELAFKAIFQLEFNNSSNENVIDYEELAISTVLDESLVTDNIENNTVDEEGSFPKEEKLPKKLKPKHVIYIKETVKNTMTKLTEIDEIISAHLKKGWSLKRLAAVDRNILRLAVYELKFAQKIIPKGIIINDAVDIAKKYGTEHSGRFVNGILGAIAK